ncbi:hypothetical protein Tco_1248259, partial [Tanacetum coccineum]
INNIEMVIDAQVLLEEELRIKEQNVKKRRNDVKRMNELELQKQESMINARTTSDAKGAQMSKNGSENDNVIARAFHDKDNIN